MGIITPPTTVWTPSGTVQTTYTPNGPSDPLPPDWQPPAPAAVVTWSPSFTVPLNNPGRGPLLGGNLTMINQGGQPGQGTAVSNKFGQSADINGLPIYWETTWTSNSNPTALQGGIGVIATEAFSGARDVNDLALVFKAFATDGTNGCLIRPNGETCYMGTTTGPVALATQQEGDTLGFVLDFSNPFSPGKATLTFFGVAGPSIVANGATWQSGFFAFSFGTYVPCAVFGTASAFDIFSVTANFGRDPTSFLGPAAVPGFLGPGLVSLGWPNKATPL